MPSKPKKSPILSDIEPLPPLDMQQLSMEVIRVLRGRRSQSAFSRYLGFNSSVVHRWEAGKTWPTASTFLSACARSGRNVGAALEQFFHRRPSWLDSHEPTSPEAVAALLRQLRGKTPLSKLAQGCEFNRYALSRWFSGNAQPSLPQFLSLVEIMSRRCLDLLSALVELDLVPSARVAWRRLQTLREVAYKEVWSHAVLRGLETHDYLNAAEPEAWLLETLGLSHDELARALDVLAASGQIHRVAGRWLPNQVTTLATGAAPSQRGLLTQAWSGIAMERMQRGHPGHYGYSLFAVSREDLRRIRDLQVEYLRAMQAIIAKSEPSECVGLLCLQLLDFSPAGNNALS